MNESRKPNEPHFTIEIDGIDAPLRVRQFWGEEGVSRLFHFSIEVESDQRDINPVETVGKKAVFALCSHEHLRKIRGIVSRFEFCRVERHVGIYNIDLSPELFRLSLIQQSRIFQEQSAVNVLKEVLTTAGMPSKAFRFACSASYRPLEYCVQYRESDLDFFNRISEQFGIFYFHEFMDHETTLVLGDSPNVHPAIAGSEELPYHVPGGLLPHRDCIHEFRLAHALRSGKVFVRDFNFETPHLDLSCQAAARKAELEWYDYPARYATRDDGSVVAKIRLEAENCERHNGSGMSDSVRLLPGATFKLTAHPVQSLNSAYLITGVVHNGAQPTQDNVTVVTPGYSNEIHVQSAEDRFRPASRTRRPVVEGSQTATVSGPAGEEIFSDKYGRVKVRFHWDRSASPNDKSSCWVRVAHLWASKGWGAVFIPRIGQEVIVDFLEGDPDRPIITGCVYNAMNMPPYPLPDKQTMATIKSDSTIGGGGSNELRFEDQKGSEEVYLHAQKDLKIVTENDKNQTVGNNETLDIAKNRTKSVHENEQSTIDGNRTEHVGKDEAITIDGKRTKTVKKDEKTSIDGSRTETVRQNEKIVVRDGSRKVTIKKADELSAQTITLTGRQQIILKVGANSIKLTQSGIEINGVKIKESATATIDVTAAGITTVKGALVKLNC